MGEPIPAFSRILLPSNRGTKSLTIDVHGTDVETLRCDISLWSALPYLSGTESTTVVARDIALSRTELRALISCVEAWLALPLDSMAVTPLKAAVDLGIAPNYSLNVEIQGGLLGHTNVSIALDQHGVYSGIWMYCDQSCWRLFCDAVHNVDRQFGS